MLLFPRDGYYYLFYSGNVFYDPGYYVGVARSRNITGPYERRNQPVLQSDRGNGDARFFAPG